MPKARNREQRSIQVLRWCEANWPNGRKARIQWVDELVQDPEEVEEGDEPEEWAGETSREGRGMLITLSRKANRTWRETIDTVIHEYTHLIQWPIAGKAEDPLDHHPASFGAQYWEIKDRWEHHGGHADASEFDWK